MANKDFMKVGAALVACAIIGVGTYRARQDNTVSASPRQKSTKILDCRTYGGEEIEIDMNKYRPSMSDPADRKSVNLVSCHPAYISARMVNNPIP